MSKRRTSKIKEKEKEKEKNRRFQWLFNHYNNKALVNRILSMFMFFERIWKKRESFFQNKKKKERKRKEKKKKRKRKG